MKFRALFYGTLSMERTTLDLGKLVIINDIIITLIDVVVLLAHYCEKIHPQGTFFLRVILGQL